jgi:hypothetical protein
MAVDKYKYNPVILFNILLSPHPNFSIFHTINSIFLFKQEKSRVWYFSKKENFVHNKNLKKLPIIEVHLAIHVSSSLFHNNVWIQQIFREAPNYWGTFSNSCFIVTVIRSLIYTIRRRNIVVFIRWVKTRW